MNEQSSPSGPDLTEGVALSDLVDGRLLGHVGDDEVLLVARGADLFAIGAHCSHYHGPLAEGLVVGDTVRCPWHHACYLDPDQSHQRGFQAKLNLKSP